VIEGSRRHRDRLLVKFEGIGSRTEAEALRGSVFVTPGQLRALADGEFWEHEVMGCSVTDVAGEHLGRVTGLVRNPAQDLLWVTTPAGDRLVPLVKGIVVDMDPERGVIVVDAPAGLLD
jgi:16S rRNA processing protein RimM